MVVPAFQLYVLSGFQYNETFRNSKFIIYYDISGLRVKMVLSVQEKIAAASTPGLSIQISQGNKDGVVGFWLHLYYSL